MLFVKSASAPTAVEYPPLVILVPAPLPTAVTLSAEVIVSKAPIPTPVFASAEFNVPVVEWPTNNESVKFVPPIFIKSPVGELITGAVKVLFVNVCEAVNNAIALVFDRSVDAIVMALVPSKLCPAMFLAVASAVAVSAFPDVSWLPDVFTPGRLIAAEPSKLTPPIALAVAKAVAVAAFPVVEPDDPDTFPVTFPVRFPVICPSTVSVVPFKS